MPLVKLEIAVAMKIRLQALLVLVCPDTIDYTTLKDNAY